MAICRFQHLYRNCSKRYFLKCCRFDADTIACDRSVVEVSLLHALDARAHFDGLALTELSQGDRLVLRRAKDTARFVHPPGYSYFAMLREKLSWSEAAERGAEQD